MTASAQTARSGPFSGDGSSTNFSYTFLITAYSELEVVLEDANGNETIQVLDTDFTAVGLNDEAGGTITMTSAPSATETISIRRNTPISQTLDLENRARVQPANLETTYDKIIRICQDLDERVDRALLAALSGAGADYGLPAASADKVLGWNSLGTALENKTPNTSAYITLPGASTDNTIPRFNGTGGNDLQVTNVTIDDNDNITADNAYIQGQTSGMFRGDGTTPVFRANPDGLTGYADLTMDGATAVWDIDPGAVDANSGARIDIDNVTALALDGTGLYVGNGTPDRALNLNGKTDAVSLPSGTTAQRPGTPRAGDFRWNSDTGAFEGYDGFAWGEVGGSGSAAATNGGYGCVLSQDVDTDHDINITAGAWRDGGDAVTIELTSEITKQIDAAWAVGDDQGGLDTGAVAADTWYAVWLIRRSDTGVVDALFSASFSAPTMPTNYDQKRLIGAVLTNATSNILPFTQHGNDLTRLFVFDDRIEDLNTATPATTATSLTLSVPPVDGTLAHIQVYLGNNFATYAYIQDANETDTTPSASYFTISCSDDGPQANQMADVNVDGSGTIRYRSSDGTLTGALVINTKAFTMFL